MMLDLLLLVSAISFGPDPYRVLGVPRSATHQQIRRAYHQQAKELHPDKNPGNADAQRRFIDLQQAYETLKDGEKRSKYDAGGAGDFFGSQQRESAHQRESADGRQERRRTSNEERVSTSLFEAWMRLDPHTQRVVVTAGVQLLQLGAVAIHAVGSLLLRMLALVLRAGSWLGVGAARIGQSTVRLGAHQAGRAYRAGATRLRGMRREQLIQLAVAVVAVGVIGYAARDVLAAWASPLRDRAAAALEATAQRGLTALLALSRLLLQWLLDLARLAARFVGRNAVVRAAAEWVAAMGAGAWQRLVVLMERLKGLLVTVLNSMS